jgi:hypothetical protein
LRNFTLSLFEVFNEWNNDCQVEDSLSSRRQF